MPKHDVARAVLIVIDAEAVRDNSQVLNPPVARTHDHGTTGDTTMSTDFTDGWQF
jgi:hypothetical protein